MQGHIPSDLVHGLFLLSLGIHAKNGKMVSPKH